MARSRNQRKKKWPRTCDTAECTNWLFDAGAPHSLSDCPCTRSMEVRLYTASHLFQNGQCGNGPQHKVPSIQPNAANESNDQRTFLSIANFASVLWTNCIIAPCRIFLFYFFSNRTFIIRSAHIRTCVFNRGRAIGPATLIWYHFHPIILVC